LSYFNIHILKYLLLNIDIDNKQEFIKYTYIKFSYIIWTFYRLLLFEEYIYIRVYIYFNFFEIEVNILKVSESRQGSKVFVCFSKYSTASRQMFVGTHRPSSAWSQISADRRSQLADRVAGKRSRAVFAGAQLGIPVVVAAVVRLMRVIRWCQDPDTLSSRTTTRTRGAAHRGSGSELVDGIAYGDERPRDNGAIPSPPADDRNTNTISRGRRTRTFTDDGTVPRNRLRQGALSSTVDVAFQHRESQPGLASCCRRNKRLH